MCKFPAKVRRKAVSKPPHKITNLFLRWGPAARCPHPMSSVDFSLRALDGGPPVASPRLRDCNKKFTKFPPIENAPVKQNAKIVESIRLNVCAEGNPESLLRTAVVKWPK